VEKEKGGRQSAVGTKKKSQTFFSLHAVYSSFWCFYGRRHIVTYIEVQDEQTG